MTPSPWEEEYWVIPCQIYQSLLGSRHGLAFSYMLKFIMFQDTMPNIFEKFPNGFHFMPIFVHESVRYKKSASKVFYFSNVSRFSIYLTWPLIFTICVTCLEVNLKKKLHSTVSPPLQEISLGLCSYFWSYEFITIFGFFK